MLKDVRALTSLLSGTGLLVMGSGLMFSLLGTRASTADFSPLVTGLVMSAYFAGFALGVYACPQVIRRVGHIRAFAAMASVSSTMPVLHALWVDPVYWGILRAITGVCLVGLYIAIESWLNMASTKTNRGRVFGAYTTVSWLASAAGQWLLLVGQSVAFAPYVLASVLLSLALVPISLTSVQEPQVVEVPKLQWAFLWNSSPIGVVGGLASGLSLGAFYGLGAVFGQGVGFDESSVASFMALTIVGGALATWPLGSWSDKVDRRWVIFLACTGGTVLAALGYVLTLTGAIYWLPTLGFFLGMYLFPVYGLSVAHGNDWVEPARTLDMTGGLLLMHGIGAAVGPTLAGALMGWLGASALMLYLGVIALVYAGLVLWRLRHHPAVPEEEKFDFVPWSEGVSPAVLQLAPHVGDDQEGPPEPATVPG
jgi:MFS family permease